MSTLSKAYFITTTINSSSIVKSTKLDSTIKAIINNYKNLSTKESSLVIEYLNTLRIVYYLKRLKYYNSTRYSSTLDLLRKSKIDLEYLFILRESSTTSEEIPSILERLNSYLVYTSILFKDYSKYFLSI